MVSACSGTKEKVLWASDLHLKNKQTPFKKYFNKQHIYIAHGHRPQWDWAIGGQRGGRENICVNNKNKVLLTVIALKISTHYGPYGLVSWASSCAQKER